MLNKVKIIKQYKINCIDGEIGKVKDFYFDDQTWRIKYLIVNTGNWLTGRQVLISPLSISFMNKEEEYMDINLTKSQIENSPVLSSDKPVSLQFESEFNGYFAYPLYETQMQYSGAGNILPINLIENDEEQLKKNAKEVDDWDPNLRSANNVIGYNIQAIDDKIGHVEDFIIDIESWKIYYLEIDTRFLLPGKQILISPNWIDHISWDESKVFVDLTTEAMEKSPEYKDESLLDRAFETQLYNHYNRDAYWLAREEVVNNLK